MIANDLAMRLAEKHAQRGRRFLDPFCGTARTVMAAAAFGMEGVGVDVNPLAVLISRAKAANVEVRELCSVIACSTKGRTLEPMPFDLQPNRKVGWFSPEAQFELRQIVTWINLLTLSHAARLVLAAVLSATAREVSYCRKGQWKLHRMPIKERQAYCPLAWDVFVRRLRRVIAELESEPSARASTEICEGDCRTLSQISEVSLRGPFNLVITSPPYGDSRTTVSYGDVSALCLGVIQHLRNIDTVHVSSRSLDNACLGGESQNRCKAQFRLRDYWAGGKENEARTRSEQFLMDLGVSCREMNAVLSDDAAVIFVVSRRSAGGRRLYIDEFLKDTLSAFGFSLKTVETRHIVGKMTPPVVNARGTSLDPIRVNTMRQELVLSFGRA
jgi:predicted RNA methylase